MWSARGTGGALGRPLSCGFGARSTLGWDAGVRRSGPGRSPRALASNAWNWFFHQPARKARLSSGVRAESLGRGLLRAPGSHSLARLGTQETLPPLSHGGSGAKAPQTNPGWYTQDRLGANSGFMLKLHPSSVPATFTAGALDTSFPHSPSSSSSAPPHPHPTSPDPTRQTLIWSAVEQLPARAVAVNQRRIEMIGKTEEFLPPSHLLTCPRKDHRNTAGVG